VTVLMAPKGRLSTKQIKERGAHYTPPDLARFLAANVVSHVPPLIALRILDPACGDGELLEAVAVHLPSDVRRTSTFFGMENDDHALADTRRRLSLLPDPPRVELIHTDFLAWTQTFRQPRMFEEERDRPERFDIVIANPPYVRTQVLGADIAKQLSVSYGLTGRVDLYHAFALAMTHVLKEGGVLGLLCSNRFLSVQSGASLREVLIDSYELHDIFDLGDTKLFEAAVLPAIVVGTRRTGNEKSYCRFTKIYELHDKKIKETVGFPDALSAINAQIEGIVHVKGHDYRIERGTLASPAEPSEPWRISSPERESWLARIKLFAPKTFADLVKIRVGVKTTADNVFIRDDWETLPYQLRPEEELLRPLLSNDVAEQWWPTQPERQPYILYTHTVESGRRSPIDLEKYPRTKRYFEAHREQLSSRKYVIEAGRRWYEIWVPQNPDDWQKPKVVFSDISRTPRFFLDKGGSVVDGNCYWFTADNEDCLYLLLAVANSSFILRYYDLVCGNRLYAGRRRFITQYVERFPVPRLDSTIAQRIIAATRRLCESGPDSKATRQLSAAIDWDVWNSLGLSEEIPG
jgi:adenine-specific DNA-methyltransferase